MYVGVTAKEEKKSNTVAYRLEVAQDLCEKHARCVHCTMRMAGRYSNGRAASSKMSRCEVFWE